MGIHHHNTMLVSAVFWSFLNQAFYRSENAGSLRELSGYQRHHFADQGSYSHSYVFSSSHVWMWELDHKEGWVLKNWCFWTAVVEKTLENSSDSKDINPLSPEGNQPWIFIGRTDAKAVAPVLWPPDAKSQLIGKYPDAGKGWGHEEKGVTEGEMVGWHHRLHGHGFGWTLGVGDGQGGLVCCGSRGHKESDATQQLNWTELLIIFSWLWHDQLNGHEFEQILGDSEGQRSLACYRLCGHRGGHNLVTE